MRGPCERNGRPLARRRRQPTPPALEIAAGLLWLGACGLAAYLILGL